MNPHKEMGRVLDEAEAALTGMSGDQMFGFIAAPAWADRHRGAVPEPETMARWMMNDLRTIDRIEAYQRAVGVALQREQSRDRAKDARG